MARARRALACALALVAMPLPAPAQSLRPLHVDVLAMRADARALRVGEVFHLTIHVHVAEQLDALDELVVPDVGTMQLLGDERRVTRGANGTDVLETLTLEPTAAGRFTFAGAYFDAVDARTKKRSRFSAAPLAVVVDGAPQPETPARSTLGWLAVFAFALLVLFAASAVALVVLARLRRRDPPAPLPPPAAAPPPARTAREAVADALRGYRAAPSGEAIARLRGALFAAAGANAGMTLRDALAANSDDALRAALAAAERAAFGPAHAREAASVELVSVTEAWLSGVPAEPR